MINDNAYEKKCNHKGQRGGARTHLETVQDLNFKLGIQTKAIWVVEFSRGDTKLERILAKNTLYFK